MFVVMGFTGTGAARWKVAYIEAFNEMEKVLQRQNTGRAVALATGRTMHDGIDSPLFNELIRLFNKRSARASQAIVLTYLVESGAHQHWVRRSLREIRQDIGEQLCASTIWKATGDLCEEGLMDVRRTGGGGAATGFLVVLGELAKMLEQSELDVTVLPGYNKPALLN